VKILDLPRLIFRPFSAFLFLKIYFKIKKNVPRECVPAAYFFRSIRKKDRQKDRENISFAKKKSFSSLSFHNGKQFLPTIFLQGSWMIGKISKKIGFYFLLLFS